MNNEMLAVFACCVLFWQHFGQKWAFQGVVVTSCPLRASISKNLLFSLPVMKPAKHVFASRAHKGQLVTTGREPETPIDFPLAHHASLTRLWQDRIAIDERRLTLAEARTNWRAGIYQGVPSAIAAMIMEGAE